MTDLASPRHPMIVSALKLARVYCKGQIIDDAPALKHAVLVATTLVKHVPDAPPELVAAVLLHDAPDFAPTTTDLTKTLDREIGPGVAQTVNELHTEHETMRPGAIPRLRSQPVMLALAADKIVAFRSLLQRAPQPTAERAEYWHKRIALRDLMPYFHQWHKLAQPHLPTSLAADLARALTNLTTNITTSTGQDRRRGDR